MNKSTKSTINSTTKTYDVIIIGAGIVGQTLAIGLAKQALAVALVDANAEPLPIKATVGKATSKTKQSHVFAPRVSAISSASASLLKQLNVWDKIARMQPYTHMQVWDTDGFGEIAFDVNSVPSLNGSNSIGKTASAPQIDEKALGHIIENEVINYALHQQLSTFANVDCFFNASASNFAINDNGATLKVQQADKTEFNAEAKLLVGADGANSRVRAAFGFAHTFWDYDHHAIVANMTTECAHDNTARQAFTPFGPLAFLPLPDARQSSIVFSQQTQQAQALMALSNSDFEKAVQVAINNHYGKVELSTKRISFPLRMRYARQWTSKHVAIIGDAAHTIHPLAGQGANLGLADVETLLSIVAQNKSTLGETAMLRKYERCRKAQALKVIATMEGFKQLFDGHHPLKKLARNLGLLGANKLPGIKAFFIKQAMG